MQTLALPGCSGSLGSGLTDSATDLEQSFQQMTQTSSGGDPPPSPPCSVADYSDWEEPLGPHCPPERVLDLIKAQGGIELAGGPQIISHPLSLIKHRHHDSIWHV